MLVENWHQDIICTNFCQLFITFTTNFLPLFVTHPLFLPGLLIHIIFVGKYINGTTIPVDGGLWLSRPRHLQKEAVKQLSRAVEKRSREKPVGVPTSKL
jgi:hypothetical protein